MQRKTPYDFVAITDHSEYYGVFKNMADPKNPLSKTDFAKRLASSDPKQVQSAAIDIIATIAANDPVKDFIDPKLLKSNWQDFIEVADKYNDPGKFTTLYAYEWTSIPDGQNMHRNVFFKDKPAALPFRHFNPSSPRISGPIWRSSAPRASTSIAIPHNGNVSNGLMYAPTKMNGDPIDARYARRQMENEPLTEIHQTKGNSEAHPLLSPNDEFASFEQFPNLISLDHPSQVTNGYIRQGLVMGMLIESKLGFNPFKMGIVAGADVHSGYQGNEEWDWKGAHGVAGRYTREASEPHTKRVGRGGLCRLQRRHDRRLGQREYPRGNLRSDAEQGNLRHHGHLIRLRFFGGWDYSKNLVKDKNFVEKAYKGGVPMGQDLPKKPPPRHRPLRSGR